MSDVFISYARSTGAKAALIDETLSGLGYSVWRDTALPIHRPYPRVIEERLKSAKAVIVLWSHDAAASDWVRAEADVAREAEKLIQVSLDDTPPPMPFNQIQCGDLGDWSGDQTSISWRRLMASLSALAGPAAIAGGGNAPAPDDAKPAGGPTATLAVLPFVNVSSDPEQEYFSDGLSDELMTQLAHLPGLRVTGRASAFAFKGHDEDLRDIGRKLGVAQILEGSVRKAGRRLRVTARLVACADGYQMWSQTFDRELDDVFAIQEELGTAVTRALGVIFRGGPQSPDYGGTRSFEAFDQFLKGRFLPGTVLTRRQFEARATYLRRALAIDPQYALAWANLSTLLAYRQTSASSAEARALDAERDEAAQRGFALAPELPLACIAQGWVEADRHNWLAAAAAVRRALQTGSGRDAHVDGIAGAFLTDIGRIGEGVVLRERARDSDPLWHGWSVHVLSSYLTLGQWDRFDAEYLRSQELEGDRQQFEALRLMRLMVADAGQDEIAEQLDRVQQLIGSSSPFAALADAPASPEIAAAVLRRHLSAPPATLFVVAQLAGLLGDVDLAFEALTAAVSDARLVHLQQLWRPELRRVRADERFKALMRTLGLAQFWRASGRWPDQCRPLGEDDFVFVG